MKINIPVKSLSVNRAYSGRHFKTRDYVDFCRDVCRTLPRAKKTITGACRVSYTFHESNYIMVDVDNQIKTIQDMIVALEYIFDDRQIIELCAKKIKCKKGEEKIIINIEEI